MLLPPLDRTARPHRPLGETPQAYHAVVHHQRSGHADIDAEAGGDLHDEVAALHQCRRQAAALRPQHIGGPQRMPEARQLYRLVQQLDADQGTALRQLQARHVRIVVDRQMARGIRCVRDAKLAFVQPGVDGEGEAGAERMGRPDKVAHVERFADALYPDCKISTHEPHLAPERPPGQGGAHETF